MNAASLDDLALSDEGELLVASGLGSGTGVGRANTRWFLGPRSMTRARYDPAGKVVASGDVEGVLRLWHPGGTSATVAEHYPAAIRDLDHAADGTLAVAVGDGTIHLRGPDGTDRTIITLSKELVASDAQFSPDGRLLAVACRIRPVFAHDDGVRRSVIVWDVQRGRERTRLETGDQDSTALDFSADGTHLIVATGKNAVDDNAVRRENRLRFWETGDFSETAGLDIGEAGGFVLSVAAGRDGTFAVARSKGAAEIRRLPDGKVLRTLDHPFPVRQAVYSPDGRTLATSTTDATSIRLWDVATGREIARLAGPWNDEPNSLAFSPDGTRLVSAGVNGQVGVWQLDPEKVVAETCPTLRVMSEADRKGGTELPALCQA